MCSIKYTKPIRKKIPDSTPDLANKLFSRDGCNKSPMTIFFFFLLWAPSETKNLSTPVSEESQFQTLGVMAEMGAKLLIKLNCLPCVFASPDAQTIANSEDNRKLGATGGLDRFF